MCSVRNILACYSRGERFSLDLGMAVRAPLLGSARMALDTLPVQVLRQGVFVDKMKTLGWLNTDRFKGDDTLLRRSIARYHAFLDLIFSSSSMFCVPTLDIVRSRSLLFFSQRRQLFLLTLAGPCLAHTSTQEALSRRHDCSRSLRSARGQGGGNGAGKRFRRYGASLAGASFSHLSPDPS